MRAARPPRPRHWCGCEARWQSRGREFLHWSATDFGDIIPFGTVPPDLIAALAETLARIGHAHRAERFGDAAAAPGALH